MTTSVEQYFIDGCMRCGLGGTTDCKVHRWSAELELLRKIILSTELKEVSKWGVPCYTLNGANVLTLTALNEYTAISFFKGVLLKDDHQLLVKPGENSQAARYLKFTEVEHILEKEDIIRQYLLEAIEIEKKGLKLDFKKNPEPIPEELETKFLEDPIFKSAFESLTPGRQRGYIIHFSQPKQSSTRISRIEKYTANILNGIGINDKYQSQKRKR